MFGVSWGFPAPRGGRTRSVSVPPSLYGTKKPPVSLQVVETECDTDRTQTCNLLIRSQMLYSIKLRCLLLHHKSSAFSDNSKIYIPIFVKIYHPSHL